MAWVVGFVVVGIVLAIAASFVIREAARMREEPPPAVFDPDDAYEFVVANLPDLVAATLTPADVRRILDFQLEFFRRNGVSVNGTMTAPRGPVVFGTVEATGYVGHRCAETGEAYLPEQIEAVVETQLAYLRAIGAIGPIVRPGGTPPPRPGTPRGPSSEGPPPV